MTDTNWGYIDPTYCWCCMTNNAQLCFLFWSFKYTKDNLLSHMPYCLCEVGIASWNCCNKSHLYSDICGGFLSIIHCTSSKILSPPDWNWLYNTCSLALLYIATSFIVSQCLLKTFLFASSSENMTGFCLKYGSNTPYRNVTSCYWRVTPPPTHIVWSNPELVWHWVIYHPSMCRH